MLKKFNQLLFLIEFLLKAKSIYRIHSPFLYKLAEEVFQNKKISIKNPNIESLRSELKKNKTKTTTNSFALSKFKTSTISKVAKSSLTSKHRSEILYNLISYFNCKKIIELGTNLGINTLYMASANPKAKVYSIEACNNLFNLALKNTEICPQKNIELIKGTFNCELPRLFKELEYFDLIYIDGDHTYASTINYFNLCLKHKHEKSIIVFDDIYWSKGMKKAWEEIIKNEEVTLSLNYFFSGIVFFRPELSKENFIFKYQKFFFTR